jgi:hypothetical protein
MLQGNGSWVRVRVLLEFLLLNLPLSLVSTLLGNHGLLKLSLMVKQGFLLLLLIGFDMKVVASLQILISDQHFAAMSLHLCEISLLLIESEVVHNVPQMRVLVNQAWGFLWDDLLVLEVIYGG